VVETQAQNLSRLSCRPMHAATVGMFTMKPTKKKQAGKKDAGKPTPLVVEVVKKVRKKNPPRTAFKKGGPNPHAFVAGNGSSNSGGKPRQRDHLLSKTLCIALADRAPDAVTDGMNLPRGSSWSQCLVRRLIIMAVRGDLQAIKEIREATEGTRTHMSLDLPDPDSVLPVIQIEFVSSDGDGRPSASFIEAHPEFVAGGNAGSAGNAALALPAPED
jgi:hypothetical protein